MGVFSELKPINHARRNPFDLSCFSTYNTKCGLMLPLKFWPTLPNSEYELDLKALMRTQPLQTAAFAGFSINYDVIWSPYNDHYSSFNQYIAQRLNKQHVTQPDISQIPNFSLNSFAANIVCAAVWDSFATELKYEDYLLWWKNGISPTGSSGDNIFVRVPRYLFYSENLPEESLALSAIRTLDLLEYGNYLGLVKGFVAGLKYIMDNADYTACPWLKNMPYLFRLGVMTDLVNATYQPASNTFNDIETVIYGANTAYDYIEQLYYLCFEDTTNLMGSLGLKVDQWYNTTQFESLWPVFTYNKAFWQFYRNEYYDIDYKYFVSGVTTSGMTKPKYSQNTLPYVNLFNMDDISQSIDISFPTGEGESEEFERLLCMFAIKPHQYKKDLFTGVLPSTQYGNVSVASSDDVFAKLIASKPSGSSSPLTQSSSSSQGPDVVYSSGLGYDVKYKFDPTPMISVLELRKADALQRFKERMLRAGNKTKDIFKAHGWEEPLSEKAFDVQFFGTFDGRLDINVVAATAESGDFNVGQLAANGISAIGGKKIHFNSHDFGTLMVVAYITKDAVYDAYGVQKSHSLLEPFDFPYPELQNISLSPIDAKELFNAKTRLDSDKVIGYLPQNMAYKTAKRVLALNNSFASIGEREIFCNSGYGKSKGSNRLCDF